MTKGTHKLTVAGANGGEKSLEFTVSGLDIAANSVSRGTGKTN